MRDQYLNYIGGKWVGAKTGEFFENRNPADKSDLIGLFPKSSQADVDRAVKAATDAFDSWRLDPRAETRRDPLSPRSGPHGSQGGLRPSHDAGRGPAPVRRREGYGQRAPEASHTVLDTFSEWKSIYVDYSGRLQKAQIDTSE